MPLKFIRTVHAPGPRNAISISVGVKLESEVAPGDNDISLVQIQKQATECGKELRRNMAVLIHDRSVDSGKESLTYWEPRIWLGMPERKIYAAAIVDAPRLKEAMATLAKMGYERVG